MKIYPIVVESMSFDMTAELTGYNSCIIVEDKFGHPYMFYLNKINEPSILVRSFLYDAGPHFEVGSLTIKETEEIIDGKKFDIGEDFSNSTKIKKMISKDSDAYIESGIVLISEIGRKIFICASSSPYTIYIDCDFYRDKFEPEEPIEKQQEVPWM